jgi:hypothetical protein
VRRGDAIYQTYKTSEPWYLLAIPLAMLVIVVAIVSGLVFGGVIQGHAERVGPAQSPTTESTILIVP